MTVTDVAMAAIVAFSVGTLTGAYIEERMTAWKKRPKPQQQRSAIFRDGWEAGRSKLLYGSIAENPHTHANGYHSHQEWKSGYVAFDSTVRNLSLDA